jgi:uncharacterized protein YbcI
VGAHVESLSAERSACTALVAVSRRLMPLSRGFFLRTAGALEALASPHYDFDAQGRECWHALMPGSLKQTTAPKGLASPAGASVAEADAKPTGRAPLGGGHLLAAISTRIVGILREHYGRGPMRAKTYALDDIIVVVMRGSGFTPLEQTIMDSGEPDRVIAMREDFQRVMAARYKQTIEELTGRKVLAFLSQAHVEPDITMEIFFVDGPLEGFGAVEVTEPE